MLAAKNVTVKYGARTAVADVSLQIAAGQLTAIIGANGAGKSTLLGTLNGAIGAASGEISLDGHALHQLSRRSVARQIAVVAQEADLRFPVTVLEFVLGGRFARSSPGSWGWETQHDLEVAHVVLKETELADMSGRLLSELSGGERQRAVLARALATEAAHLLLDEPTANLDLAHQATILRLVRERCDRKGVAAAVVTHGINLAAEFADQILLMKHGKMLASGTAADVLTPELLEAAFTIKVLVDAHPLSGVPRITPVHQALGNL